MAKHHGGFRPRWGDDRGRHPGHGPNHPRARHRGADDGPAPRREPPRYEPPPAPPRPAELTPTSR